MGLRVNFFVLFVIILSLNLKTLPGILFIFSSIGFIFLYQHWKIWQFIGKFPGGKKFPSIKNLFENSSSEFYENLIKIWSENGKDKFVTWIGFERFVGVSKWSDVKAVLAESIEGENYLNFSTVWPWIGGDCLKSSDFDIKIIDNIFSSGSFKNLIQSQKFIDEICKNIKTLHQKISNGNEDIDIQKTTRILTFDVMMKIALGSKMEYNKELFEDAEKLTSMADKFFTSGWHQSSVFRKFSGFDRKFKILLAKFEEEISKMAIENVDKLTLNQILNQNHDDKNICGYISTFILLGYDRISTALISALIEASKNSKKDENLISKILKQHPTIPIIHKFTTQGIPLKGFFIPPSTNVLIFLNSKSEAVENLMKNSEKSFIFNFLQIILENFEIEFVKGKLKFL